MIEFLSEYGLFLAKAVTIVVAILIVAGTIVALSARSQSRHKEHIEVKRLNQRYEDMAMALRSVILPRKAFKKTLKEHKKQDKQQARQAEADATRRRIFVLDFHGDIRASAVAALREEITAILTVADTQAGDEVLLRLESGGGLVHTYGLAASQLTRIRDKQLKLTIAVDKIAASGGYMMACVADTIIAAPFAVVGSIGVLAQLPNFHRLLRKNEIDFEQFTAGEYKRTVTMFGENTEQDRAKFRQDLEDTHQLFKDFVAQHRSQLDLAKVATGEHWYGTRALELKLIDELRTSDDYLLAASQDADLFEITYTTKKPLLARFLEMAQLTLEKRYPLPHERIDQHLL